MEDVRWKIEDGWERKRATFDARPRAFVAAAATLWFAAYLALAPLADALVASLPVAPESRLGETIRFFLYDTPKVLLLLIGVVMVMGRARRWAPCSPS